MIKKLLFITIFFSSLNIISAETKVQAEQNYTELTPDILKNLKDIFIKNGLTVDSLHPIVFDYLSQYKCLSSFNYYSFYPNKLCALANDNLITSATSSLFFNNTFQITDVHIMTIWDTNLNKTLQELEVDRDIRCICGLNNNQYAFAYTYENCIHIRDLDSPEYSKTLKGHTDTIKDLFFLKDHRLASVSWFGIIKIWDINTGSCLQTFDASKNGIYSVLLVQNDTLVTKDYNGKIQILDFDGKLLVAIDGVNEFATCACFLPNKKIALAYEDGKIKIWDLDSGKYLQTLQGHAKEITSLCLLTNNLLVSGSTDGKIITWDLKGNKLQTIDGYDKEVISICALTNGRFASTGTDSNNDITMPWGKLDHIRTAKIWAPTF